MISCCDRNRFFAFEAVMTRVRVWLHVVAVLLAGSCRPTTHWGGTGRRSTSSSAAARRRHVTTCRPSARTPRSARTATSASTTTRSAARCPSSR